MTQLFQSDSTNEKSCVIPEPKSYIRVETLKSNDANEYMRARDSFHRKSCGIIKK